MNVILLTAVILVVTLIDSGVGSSTDGNGKIEASESSLLVSKVLRSRVEASDHLYHPKEVSAGLLHPKEVSEGRLHPKEVYADLPHPKEVSAGRLHPKEVSEGLLLIGDSAYCPSIVPCQVQSNVKEYAIFVHDHILAKCFNRRSWKDWERYLEETGLCGMTDVQSFIDSHEREVQQICRGEGWRLKDDRVRTTNLCISESKMVVYRVTSSNKKICMVTDVTSNYQEVIVACNKIDDRCFPVHYEASSNGEKGDEICSV